ncbi:DUF3311 domain-containing protein [Halosolutus amylolyticus]|uniref:DUF3311 domain-containing protein n=1 Tax=Halosolutus amylolyticus TaxID=2932267 RepID=A0ABD5PR45_9EURY|nr:DUF3311 domain-containing protein [Halosolutus amylolyticus]
MRRLELWSWIAIGIVLSALAIPWFLWGSATVVAGLPLWLWWHVGWMLLASIVFWVFARRAWGIGVEPGRDGSAGKSSGTAGEPTGTGRNRDASVGGERR